MASQILINTVPGITYQGQPFVAKSGSTITDAALQTLVAAEGGVLVPAGNAAAAAIVTTMHSRGANEDLCDRVMIAALAGADYGVPKFLRQRSLSSSSSITEFALGSFKGAGSVLGVYFTPDATSTPSSGSNSQAALVQMYDGAGNSVLGTVASFTCANATPLTQWERTNFGAITNGAFLDGYVITAKTTLTGTATWPAGEWTVAYTLT